MLLNYESNHNGHFDRSDVQQSMGKSRVEFTSHNIYLMTMSSINKLVVISDNQHNDDCFSKE